MDSVPQTLATAWTFICAAQRRQANDEVRRACLTYLVERYREPVRAMMRAWGLRDEHLLDDRLQEYFTRFIEKNWLDDLDRNRGRFRAFLRVSVRHFLLDEKARSINRRRRVGPVSEGYEDGGVAAEGVDGERPEEAFDRSWAREVMSEALARFESYCEQQGLAHYREAFERHVLNPDRHGRPSHQQTAAHLGVTEKDVRNYAHRAKGLLRRKLHEVIRETVSSDEEVERELDDLQRYFA